jgi:hypothetical protein
MVEIKVKEISPDEWCRPRLKNIETGRIYADISLGDKKWQPIEYNIPGAWHSTTAEGEPDCPLRKDIQFTLIK